MIVRGGESSVIEQGRVTQKRPQMGEGRRPETALEKCQDDKGG